jgi:hypothetical protein
MTISDLITLVSLVIAIIAILNEKNRKHVIFKFHAIDFILISGIFLLVNYFIFYDSFKRRGWYFDQLYFEDFGLSNPKHYAYILSIFGLIYLSLKIWYAFYPQSKIRKVLMFYQELVENNETIFLADLIERYHKDDIINMIETTKDYDPNDHELARRFRRVSKIAKLKLSAERVVGYLFPYSSINRKYYAGAVLHSIINEPAFISLTANQRPYLFADLISHFRKSKRDAFPEDLVNSFFLELIEGKNFWLKKELRRSEDHDFGQPERFHDENRILASILRDLSVAEVSQVWKSFGDAAVNELEDERTKGFDSKMFFEFRDQQFLWDYKTMFAIQFFKIIVIEALKKRYEDHFWLFYYNTITDEILLTFERYPPTAPVGEISTYESFIKLMVDNVFLWLEISNAENDSSRYHDILRCLGRLLEAICKSNAIEEKRKVQMMETLLNYYCELNENSERDRLRAKIEEIMIKPSLGIESTHLYYNYFAKAWKEFDATPHKDMQGMGSDLDYFVRLKNNVIVPLGLDPTTH